MVEVQIVKEKDGYCLGITFGKHSLYKLYGLTLGDLMQIAKAILEQVKLRPTKEIATLAAEDIMQYMKAKGGE